MDWSIEKGLTSFITTRIQDQLPSNFKYDVQVIESAEDFIKLDFLLALGGDGTMLSAARAVGNRNTPILGIHLGELGFLAEVTSNEMFDRLNMVESGNYGLQKRMVIKAEINN
ncbi:uncharacterized protein METZ01_LOCUS302057, partial [marine metagenome]